MTEQPDFVIAPSDIAVVMYPDNSFVGLKVIDPADQKLFISLPGSVMKGLGQQLQELFDQHPETLSWQPVSVASEGEPEG
ncbi:MAG: hypothetical protein OES46_07425 [Gammaproteobacteria bacterium]|nr:hypothetical protein [Gammaproteobacteria bacterium]